MTILITGTTGFIGSRLLSDLLLSNPPINIRATVHRPSQIPLLQSRYLAPSRTGQLTFVLVPSLDDATALGAAVTDDVSCIIHLASPMPGKGEDFEDGYLRPAVRGTETVLEVARGRGGVRRVVVMSSVLGMISLGGLGVEGLRVEGAC